MNIYIVRHGETMWNKEEVFRGRQDIELNETGRLQAERAGHYFTGKKIDSILSSPLTRAVDTAGAITKSTGVQAELTDDFTDMSFGVWEGLPVPEVKARYPRDFTLWMECPEKLYMATGESLQMVRNRVSEGLAKAAKQETSTIVVVTHRVICKILILHLLQIGNEHFWDLKFDPGSISLVERRNGRFTLAFSNYVHPGPAGTQSAGYGDF